MEEHCGVCNSESAPTLSQAIGIPQNTSASASEASGTEVFLRTLLDFIIIDSRTIRIITGRVELLQYCICANITLQVVENIVTVP